MVYFTSDFHLGHKVIIKYRPEFSSKIEHDEYLLSLLEKLGKRDVVYMIGDFLFKSDEFDGYLQRISKFKVKIKLILGNHDNLELYKKCPENIQLQLPMFSYKNMWISHCPIHPNELRNRIGNIHGHLHKEKLEDKRYFNVNIDVNNYNLVTLDEIKNYFQ